MDASKKSLSYKGGMHWKKAKGREYLFRTRDRYGYGISLGPRSLETEKILAEFRRGKQQTKEREASLRTHLKEQARFCKAALIQRVPRVVTSIYRLLEQHRMLGHNIVVVGTNSLFAFEAAGGVFFEKTIMATKEFSQIVIGEDGFPATMVTPDPRAFALH